MPGILESSGGEDIEHQRTNLRLVVRKDGRVLWGSALKRFESGFMDWGLINVPDGFGGLTASFVADSPQILRDVKLVLLPLKETLRDADPHRIYQGLRPYREESLSRSPDSRGRISLQGVPAGTYAVFAVSPKGPPRLLSPNLQIRTGEETSLGAAAIR